MVTSTDAPNKHPIFIHSLFRAGSTYLFKVFRRSEHGYWCYQEPLHELAFFCRENPSGLQEDHGEEKVRLLRHPQIEGSYFKELKEVWPVWKDVINEQIIYDAYFSGVNENIGIAYWRVLADAAHGRPVFQECRTAGRIGAINSQIGGSHIYLWRNPWDQWWSYKVAPYFDVANQLIIHARHAPQPVQNMLTTLDLSVYKNEDLAGAFAFYGERPLTSEQSYLVFYLLWCLALREGMAHADLMLNIDHLSDSAAYQSEIQVRLRGIGISGIDISDCRVPQGRYLENDQAFFSALEGRVHQWLKEGGWTQKDIKKIQTLRQQFQPSSWETPIPDLALPELTEQASRARDLARRFETTLAEHMRNDARKLRETEGQAKAMEEKTQVAEAKVQQTEAESRANLAEGRAKQELARALQVEERANLSEARVLQEATRAERAEERANLAEGRAQQELARAERAEERVNLFEARVLQEATRAERAEERANLAEGRAQQELARAERAEERVNLFEARVLQEATRAERAEERANLAEGRAQQELARAERAEERVNLSVARVLQEATRAERAEERANLAEGRAQQELARAERAEERVNLSEARVLQEATRAERAEERANLAEGRLQQTNAERWAQVAEAKAQQTEAECRAQQAEAKTKLVEVQLEATRKELHDAHQANHHHWQQWEATKLELHSVHRSNHQHWQLAQARQETIQAIYSSRSWRVTAPLRWVARPRMGRSGTGAVPPAPTFTDRLIRWGMARPRLVAVTHTMVDGMPPLRSAISRRVANVLAVVGRVPATALEHNSLAEYARVDPIDGQPKPVVQDADLHNLSPHARHIYAGLKAAIEQNDREHA
jgi:hypothetical protein